MEVYQEADNFKIQITHSFEIAVLTSAHNLSLFSRLSDTVQTSIHKLSFKKGRYFDLEIVIFIVVKIATCCIDV